MLAIIGLITPYFGLIAVGFVAARITRQPLEALGWLNTFIVYIALPALFFILMSKTPVETLTRWDFIGINLGVTFVILLACFGLALVLSRGQVADSTIQALAGAYGNIGYMGPGLAILAFGREAAIPVALIFSFENILHFAFAPAMMAVAGQRREAPWRLALGVLRQIVTHPFILATAVGVSAAVLEWSPPEPVERLIETLADAAAPCALFAMGVTLALRPLRRVPGALGFILPIKLLVHPALMFLALTTLGQFDPVWVLTAMLLAALPTATNVFVIAQQYGVWVERASATILLSTALSVASVSALLWAIGAGWLPGIDGRLLHR
ncbi:MAG: AEC family transporter [Pseudomonadota bacterium]